MDGYGISEEWSYSDAIQQLKLNIKQADEALGALMYALNRNPKAFPLVHGETVRVAKLDERPNDGLPPFRVFFRISSTDDYVYLLHVDHGEGQIGPDMPQ
ncbi:MAG: hypothetical protein AAGK37_02675 [Pseudomonadota bacterium]